MNFAGQIIVAASREAVFDALKDAPFFASLVEGVENLSPVGDDRYEALFQTSVAYMKFRFKVNVEMSRLTPPEEIEAKIEGTPLGVVGRLTATARTRLSQAGDDTVIRYDVDATLAGKLGSIGQPVLKAKAKSMEKQFAERLRAAFASGARGAAA